MALITFTDKVALKSNDLPAENQVRAEDLNEIKSVVNANASATINTNGIGSWTLDTEHATTPPTTGKFNFDNATIGSATIFRIHKTDADGRLTTSILDNYVAGDIVVLLDKSTTNKLITIVLGAKTTETNYYEFAITSVSVVGTWSVDDNAFCLPTKASSGIAFQGEWTPATTYSANDVVRDGAFVMLANTSTDDRPSPTKKGDPAFNLDDSPSWATSNFTNVIQQSLKIENPPSFLTVSGCRFYVPSTDSSYFYYVFSKNLENDTYRFHGSWRGDDFGSTGWKQVYFDAISIDTDESYLFTFTSFKQASTVVNIEDMTFSGFSNTSADPTSGNITIDSSNGIVRVSVEDRTATSIRTTLETIKSGGGLTLIQESDGTKSNNYVVMDFVDHTTWFEFFVSLDSIGTGGMVATGQNIDLYVPDYTVAEQTVNLLSNEYSSSSWKSGQIQTDNDAPTSNQNGYGIDILIQENTKSDDWDILSFNPFANLGEVADVIGTTSDSGNTQQTLTSSLNPASETIETYYIDASGGDITLTLPISPADGTRWNIKRIDSSSNRVIITSTVSRTIDGEDELEISVQYSSFTVQYNSVSQEYFIL